MDGNSKQLQRKYISEVDEFLNKLRTEAPKSASEQREINKAVKISQLRDDPNVLQDKDLLWKDF